MEFSNCQPGLLSKEIPFKSSQNDQAIDTYQSPPKLFLHNWVTFLNAFQGDDEDEDEEVEY